MKKPFNTKARNIRFNLAAAVAEAREMFPAHADKIFFIDTYADKAIDPLIGQSPYPLQDEGTLEMGDDLSRAYKTSTSGQPEDGAPFYIFLYTGKDMLRVTDAKSMTTEQYLVFDHELAHALINKPAEQQGHFEECVADCYAMLRHYQRFGLDSKRLDTLPLSRAVDVFFGLGTQEELLHFTSPAVEKVIELKDCLHIDRKSPQETFQLAVQMARNFSIAPKTLAEWANVSEKTSWAFSRGENADALYDTADRMIEIQSPILAKWAYKVLDQALANKIQPFCGRDFQLHTVPSFTPRHAENIKYRLQKKREAYQELVATAPVFTALKN